MILIHSDLVVIVIFQKELWMYDSFGKKEVICKYKKKGLNSCDK